MTNTFWQSNVSNGTFNATTVNAAAILSRIEGMMPWLAANQDSGNGAMKSPYNNTDNVDCSADFAFGAFLCAANGNTTWLTAGINAMTYACANIGSDGNFTMLPGWLAWGLANTNSFGSSGQRSTWKSQLSTFFIPGYNNNWCAYSAAGAWAAQQVGGVTSGQQVPVSGGPGGTMTATQFIEYLWTSSTNNQKARFNAACGLYDDQNPVPLSLSTELAGRMPWTYVALVGSYSGASAGAIRSACLQGGITSLQINSPSGSTPNSGRTSDHVWVDAATQVAAQLNANYYSANSNTQRAQQFQRMANIGFTNDNRWIRTGGTDPNGHSLTNTFGITKNQFSPSSRIGFQTASDQLFYNCANVLSWSVLYQLQTANSSIGEAPFPAEQGGYVNILPTRWSQTMASAGGIFVQIGQADNGVAPASNYEQAWSVLGITRICRSFGWDERLGPADGYIANGSSIQGSAFGPAWNSNGTWTEIGKMTGFSANGGPGGNYNPQVTTQLASPCLTKLTIVWNGLSGQPTHTQKLTITPDGILSQITSTVATTNFGHALPIFHDNGATNATQSISAPIASVNYGGAYAQSFLALGSNPAFTLSETTLTSYGNLSTYRCVVNNSESAVFVYPQSTTTSDPSASSVLSSFVYTAGSQNFSSSLGWVNGNFYRGRYTAGGFGTQIGPQPGATPDAIFTTACNFVLTLNGSGVITNVETDTTTTATINGHSMSLTAFTPASVSAPGGTTQVLTASNPGTVTQGTNFTVTVTTTVPLSNLTTMQYKTTTGGSLVPLVAGGPVVSATLTNSELITIVFNFASAGTVDLVFKETASGATSGDVNFTVATNTSGGGGFASWIPPSRGRGLPRYNPGWYGSTGTPLAQTDWSETGLPPPGLVDVYSGFNYVPNGAPGSGIWQGTQGHLKTYQLSDWASGKTGQNTAIPVIRFSMAPGGAGSTPGASGFANAEFRLQDVPSGIADAAWAKLVTLVAGYGYKEAWFSPSYENNSSTTPSGYKGEYNWNGKAGVTVPQASWAAQNKAAFEHIAPIIYAQGQASGITVRIISDWCILDSSDAVSFPQFFKPDKQFYDICSFDNYSGAGYWDVASNYYPPGDTADGYGAAGKSPLALNATQYASGLNDGQAYQIGNTLYYQIHSAWGVDNPSNPQPSTGNTGYTYNNFTHGLNTPDQNPGKPDGQGGLSVTNYLNAACIPDQKPLMHCESGIIVYQLAPAPMAIYISTPPLASHSNTPAGNDLHWFDFCKKTIAAESDAGVPDLGYIVWDGPSGTRMGRSSLGCNPGMLSSMSAFNTALASGGPVTPALTLNPIGNATINTIVTVTVLGSNYTPSVPAMQANFNGSGYAALPGSPTQSGNSVSFQFTPNTTGTFSLQVEDTSKTPTVVSNSIQYTVGQAASNNTITIPATIENQSQGQQFHLTAAFNYAPVQANVVWYDLGGLQGQVALPAGAVWSDNGQYLTWPVTDNSAGAHTFNIGDKTFTPPLVSNTLNFTVVASGSGGNTYSVPIPPPVTTTGSITISAPVTAQEASVGAGVSQNITLTTNNYGTSTAIWWGTKNSSNTVLTGPTQATLVSGQVTVNVFFAENGDYVYAENATSGATLTAVSSPITITDPASTTLTISGPSPGTQTSAVAGGAVTIPLTITTQNDTNSSVFGAVFQSNGTIRGSYAPFTLTANSATATLTFVSTGDYYQIVDQVSGPTFTFKSSGITIINPNTNASFTITPPGTQYLAVGATSVTVPTIINTTGFVGAVVYWQVITAAQVIEKPYVPATLSNGSVVVQVPMLNSGDMIKVVDNPTTPTVTQVSSPVTILPPQTQGGTITVGAPGTQLEASVGAGVTVTVPVQVTGLSGQVYYQVFTSGGSGEGAQQTLWLTSDGNTPTIRIPSSLPGVKSGQSFTVQAAFNYVPVKANILVCANSVAGSFFAPVNPVWDATGQLLTWTIVNNNQAPHFLQVEDTTPGIAGQTEGASPPLVSSQTNYTPGANGTGTTFSVTPYASVVTTLNAGIPITVNMANTGDVIKVQNAASSPTVTGQSTPVLITDSGSMTPTITVSDPGTVAGTIAGSGVTVDMTVTTTNISTGTTLYWNVLTSTGQGEQTLTAFSVTAGGTTVITAVPFLNSGDTFNVYNTNDGSPTITDQSSAIVINIPPPVQIPTINVSGPASVPATSGTSASVVFQITANNLANSLVVYVQPITGIGAAEADYLMVTLAPPDSSHSVYYGTVTALLLNSGDKLQVVDNPTNPTVIAQSDPVVITPQTVIPATETFTQPSPLFAVSQQITVTISATGTQPGVVYGYWGAVPPTSSTQAGIVQFALNTTVTPTIGTATINFTNPGPVQSLWYSIDGVNWSAAWSAASTPQSGITLTLNTLPATIPAGANFPISGIISSSSVTLSLCLRNAAGAQPQTGDPDIVQAVVVAATPPATGGTWTATMVTGGAGIPEKLWYSIEGGVFQTPIPGAPVTITPTPHLHAFNPGTQYTNTPFRGVADFNYPLASLSSIQFSNQSTTPATWVQATGSNAQISGNPFSAGNSRVYFPLTDASVANPYYFQVQDLSPPGGNLPLMSEIQQYAVIAAQGGGGSPAITAFNPGNKQSGQAYHTITNFNYVVADINTVYYNNSAGTPSFVLATTAPGGAVLSTQPNGNSMITITLSNGTPGAAIPFQVQDTSPPGGGDTIQSNIVTYAVTQGPPPSPPGTVTLDILFSSGKNLIDTEPAGTTIVSQTGLLPPH